jgi:hypothetical protein
MCLKVLIFLKALRCRCYAVMHTTLPAEALDFLPLTTSTLSIRFASPKCIIHYNAFILIGHDDELHELAAVKVERQLWYEKPLRISTILRKH